MRWIPDAKRLMNALLTYDTPVNVCTPKHFTSYLFQQGGKNSHILFVQIPIRVTGICSITVEV